LQRLDDNMQCPDAAPPLMVAELVHCSLAYKSTTELLDVSSEIKRAVWPKLKLFHMLAHISMWSDGPHLSLTTIAAMASNFRWSVVLSLLNVTVAGADALHLVILATVDATQASASQSVQRQFGLAALGLSMLLSLACALSVWLAAERNMGCFMVVNALVFLAHALAFVPLGIVIFVDGHQALGLLELALALEMLAGCVCCRIHSVKVRDDVERKDALEISYEQLKIEQVAVAS
jgi:hypothetical protein